MYRTLKCVVVAYGLLACSGVDDPPAEPVKPVRSAAYASTECWFSPPKSHTVECGFVTVPVRPEVPGGPQLKLAVATVYSKSSQSASDPIVYVEGGPGQPSIRPVLEPTVLFEDVLAERDLVLIDQRGTGFSSPLLECPEVDRVGTFDAKLLLDATRRCHETLVADGVDLSAYNIQNAAADIEAVRQALGYERWNLYGISYGSRVGLEVARSYPQGVRSLALDSVLPPEVDYLADTVGGAQQSFQRVFAECKKQAACAERFPDSEAKLRELVARYDAEPLSIRGLPAPLTGREILRTLRSALYSIDTLVQVPALIHEADSGNFDWIGGGSSRATPGTAEAWGVYFSMLCSSELPFTSREAVSATLSRLDPLYAKIADVELFDLCAAWDVTPAPSTANTAVVSSTPALLLSGFFDPVTPPEFAATATQGLSRRFAFTLTDESHAASLGTCGTGLLQRFFAAPETEPASACVATRTPPTLSIAGLKRPAPASPSFAADAGAIRLRPHLVRSGAGLR